MEHRFLYPPHYGPWEVCFDADTYVDIKRSGILLLVFDTGYLLRRTVGHP